MGKASRELIWSPEAEDDLLSIWRFGAQASDAREGAHQPEDGADMPVRADSRSMSYVTVNLGRVLIKRRRCQLLGAKLKFSAQSEHCRF